MTDPTFSSEGAPDIDKTVNVNSKMGLDTKIN
jgi:hypothetical protein